MDNALPGVRQGPVQVKEQITVHITPPRSIGEPPRPGRFRPPPGMGPPAAGSPPRPTGPGSPPPPPRRAGRRGRGGSAWG